MIVEGIVTSRDAQGQLNVAPMGPRWEVPGERLVLRPFQTSRTLANLLAHPFGVFHIVDNALLLARAAIDVWEHAPATVRAAVIPGEVLRETCLWHEFEIVRTDTSTERATLVAEVRHTGRFRDPFGFNRAKHAVLEAAILATRVHLLAADDLREQLRRLQPLVDKTGGDEEREAFALVSRFIADRTIA